MYYAQINIYTHMRTETYLHTQIHTYRYIYYAQINTHRYTHTHPTCSPAQCLSVGAQPYPSRQKL